MEHTTIAVRVNRNEFWINILMIMRREDARWVGGDDWGVRWVQRGQQILLSWTDGNIGTGK